MSEQHPEIIPDQPQPGAEYAAALDGLAVTIPEIAAKREVIETAAAEIQEAFGISREFFNDPARCLVFSAVADRWSQLPPAYEDTDQTKAERAYLADALTMLAHPYSDMLKSAVQHEDRRPGYDDATDRRIYDRYTDATLTREVEQAIADGLLDDVKQRLGITPDNEDPYAIRVLSIDPDLASDGLSAPDLDSVDDSPEAFNEWSELQSDVSARQEGLHERAKQMAHELGMNHDLAVAWVSSAQDKSRTLCITMPLAEKLLHPELTKYDKYYTEEKWKNDFAFLEHEYIHTQGGLNMAQESTIGVNLEEYRAEFFSQMKHGYGEVKSFLHDLKLLTGIDVAEKMTGLPKGGTQTEIYGYLANVLGLGTMLDVLLAAPVAYVENGDNSFQVEAFHYLGGYDGVLERVLTERQARGEGEQIDERITARAKKLQEIVPDTEMRQSIYAYHARHSKLVNQLVQARDEELMRAEPESGA